MKWRKQDAFHDRPYHAVVCFLADIPYVVNHLVFDNAEQAAKAATKRDKHPNAIAMKATHKPAIVKLDRYNDWEVVKYL